MQVALPTGASTSDNQTTIIGHLDDVENQLSTISTSLNNINVAVDTTGNSAPSSVINIGTTDTSGSLRQPLVDSDGHLQVDILSGGGSNASVKVDDASFTLGSDSITMIGGFAGVQNVDSNDAAALACTTSGHLHVKNETA